MEPDAVPKAPRRRSPYRALRHRLRPLVNRPLAKLAVLLLPPLYTAYMRLVYATSEVDLGEFHRLQEACDDNDGAIALLWHEEVLTVAYGYGVVAKLEAHTLASTGDAGEVITRILERCNFRVFRGGSSRRSSRRHQAVLVSMIRHMQGERRVLYGITVDGSKGPAYQMKPGGILIAAKCGKPLVLVRTWYRRYWRAPTWDRTAIPLPWNRIEYTLSDPIFVPEWAHKGEGLERFRRQLELQLGELAARSYDRMKKPRPAGLPTGGAAVEARDRDEAVV